MSAAETTARGRATAFSFTLRVLTITTVAIFNTVLFIGLDGNALAGVTYLRDDIPHERVQLRMLMGVHKAPVKCPKGMYRPPGAGPSRGECRYCPRGVYGDSPGLTSSDCTAKCPKGTYQDRLGAKSILDCLPCPAGVYGSAPGLTNSACTAPCPLGKYSMKTGLQSASECDDCPPNYRGPQGRRGNNPYFGWEGGFPCDRYLSGKTVLNGRDADTAARRDAYLASVRTAHVTINDNTSP